jgi:uncharacterized protein
VIAVDTNILVHAHRAEMPKHERALARLRTLAEGAEPWGIPVFCLGELVRVISHPRLFDAPHSAKDAAEAVRRLTASPSLRVLSPGSRFVELFRDAIEQGGATGNLVFDAVIVAVCRESGARALLTEDKDFRRFPRFSTLSLDEA